MAWWSWLVIWGVLVLALLGMLALFAVRLFRKFVAMTEALGQLTEKLELLDTQVDEIREPFEPAVFADAAELSQASAERAVARELQRQIRRDLRVSRGKLLVRADARQFSYLIRRS